jgi:hypothetical protein
MASLLHDICMMQEHGSLYTFGSGLSAPMTNRGENAEVAAFQSYVQKPTSANPHYVKQLGARPLSSMGY